MRLGFQEIQNDSTTSAPKKTVTAFKKTVTAPAAKSGTVGLM